MKKNKGVGCEDEKKKVELKVLEKSPLCSAKVRL